MATITPPTRPAVGNYPDESAHAAELEAAKKFFDDELTASEGWDFAGEREGVKLDKKVDTVDVYAVPIVRGSTTVENATTEQVLSVIQQPGMRLLWDPRFESGDMLKRYSRLCYEFYSVMKGMGWLVWPRDILGIQKNHRSSTLNQEIDIIQTSIEDPEYPAAYGKVRAKLTGAGWKIKPVGSNVELSYLVKISLEGSIPGQLVQALATEIPTCTGRVRDVFYSHGFPPYVVLKDDHEPITQFQTEEFTSDPAVWKCILTTRGADKFSVLYDGTRMFLNGVHYEINSDDVVITDDTVGKLDVEIKEGAGKGEHLELVVSAK